jgi:hypothetical protein
MEIYTQPNNQIKDSPETSFDKQSRESYFEMLQVALENLSIVYENNSKKNGFKHKIRK